MPISTILLDIEGTTTPIDFVYQILFPYARARLKDFIKRNLADEEVRSIVAALFDNHAQDRSADLPPLHGSDNLDAGQIEEIVVYCQWLIDHDRKVAPLKTIQGKIWEEGYGSGELKSKVFTDVAPALRRWREQGKTVCIYSSGSVLAQKLLFAHTEQGGLTEFIQDFFDTSVGHKTEPGSYTRIAELVRRKPSEILFISDVVAELNAAQAAGFQTLLCVRPGNHPQSESSVHDMIYTFDEALTIA
ncbi:MAG TPA: acireductone synthase [Pyrinomonadaceae bacterium]|jgi:enolase-phosphatase E1|nr:acireductone synthase [Pyrinomonadaceae bacterium]